MNDFQNQSRIRILKMQVLLRLYMKQPKKEYKILMRGAKMFEEKGWNKFKEEKSNGWIFSEIFYSN